MPEVDLTVLSDCVVDFYFRVKKFPSAGDTVIGELCGISPGGASTVAAAAAKLGLKVAVADAVGDDALGAMLLERLGALGVSTKTVEKVRGAHTSTCVVLLGEGGEHAYLGSLGPLFTLSEETVKLVLSSRSVFFDGYALLKMDGKTRTMLDETLKEAKLRGIVVFFDPGPIVDSIEGLADTLKACSVVFANEWEWGRLTNILGSARPSDPGLTLVVKRGRRGATVFTGGASYECPTEGVEGGISVGAGDVFDAAYIWGVLAGLSPRTCCAAANAAAKIKLKGIGLESIPSLEEVLAQLEGLGQGFLEGPDNWGLQRKAGQI